MIDRAEQVRRAVAIIGPRPERRAECREEVGHALAAISNEANTKEVAHHDRTKRGYKAAGRLYSALKRAQDILRNDKDIDQYFLLAFPHAVLAEWVREAKAASERRGKTPRLAAEKKRMAVREAIWLLSDFGEKSLAANKSKLPKLAAVLHGEPRANLQSQCRAAFRKKRGSK